MTEPDQTLHEALDRWDTAEDALQMALALAIEHRGASETTLTRLRMHLAYDRHQLSLALIETLDVLYQARTHFAAAADPRPPRTHAPGHSSRWPRG